MGSHLSESTIEEYLENKIPANELLAVDDHLAECDICAQALSSKTAEAEIGEGNIDLETLPTHLSFEMLESLANDSIDQLEEEIASVHLTRCEACREALDELTVLRNELYQPTARPAATAAKKGIWQNIKVSLKPSYLLPAFGLLLVGAFAVWYLTTRGTTQIDQAAVPAVNEGLPPPSETSASPSDANANGNQNIDSLSKRTVIASVNDGGKKIELYDDGRITGIQSAQFEARVRNALGKQELSIPNDARQFSNAPGVLMGNGADGVPFALDSPVAKTVLTAAPRFVWKPLEGADSYHVEIFDENFNRIASSPALKSTSWQIQQPLRRGRIYGWQVTAIQNGAEVKSPVRPAPDARFKVVDAESGNAIAAARKQGGSRMVLGILYAEAGMLAEAEQEFAALQRANPDSAVVRSLLQKVRSAR